MRVEGLFNQIGHLKSHVASITTTNEQKQELRFTGLFKVNENVKSFFSTRMTSKTINKNSGMLIRTISDDKSSTAELGYFENGVHIGATISIVKGQNVTWDDLKIFGDKKEELSAFLKECKMARKELKKAIKAKLQAQPQSELEDSLPPGMPKPLVLLIREYAEPPISYILDDTSCLKNLLVASDVVYMS